MEADGYTDMPGMVWTDGSPNCDHPLELREITVEGGVACAGCGGVLVPEGDVSPGVPTGDVQVKYRLEGRMPMQAGGDLIIQGEWETLEIALRCSAYVSGLGGHAAVFKVITDRMTDV
jgi:hypothetical protein